MIIGVVGFKRSGKDTVAKMVCDLNPNFKQVSFAKPIKLAAMALFGWTWEQVDGVDKEVVDPRYGVSPRQILQYLGTEDFQYNLPAMFPDFKRLIGRNFWVTRVENDYIESGKSPIVISDVRFLHEYEFIKKHGGVICRVDRGIKNTDHHPSEEEQIKIPHDFIIKNMGTIKDLEEWVEGMLIGAKAHPQQSKT